MRPRLWDQGSSTPDAEMIRVASICPVTIHTKRTRARTREHAYSLWRIVICLIGWLLDQGSSTPDTESRIRVSTYIPKHQTNERRTNKFNDRERKCIIWLGFVQGCCIKDQPLMRWYEWFVLMQGIELVSFVNDTTFSSSTKFDLKQSQLILLSHWAIHQAKGGKGTGFPLSRAIVRQTNGFCAKAYLRRRRRSVVVL